MRDHSLRTGALIVMLVTVAVLGGDGLGLAAGRVPIGRPSSGELANRLVAVQDGTALLGKLQLPPGATNSPVQPAGTNPWLARPAFRLGSPKLIDLSTWWLVPGQQQEVLDWIETHPPPGARWTMSGAETTTTGGGGTEARFAGFELPPVSEVLGPRELVVEVVATPDGSTALRADAEIVWIVPRPLSEQIPAAARVLEVTVVRPGRRSPTSVVLSKARIARKIAALINGLSTSQPTRPRHECPHLNSNPTTVRLTFRATRGGPTLAEAVQVEPVGVCSPMTLTIRGHSQTPLVGAGVVLHRLKALLGEAGG